MRGRLTATIADRFATMTSDEIVERCARAKLPVAKVNRPDQLMGDPHLVESGQMLETRLPDGRSAPLPALPFRMDGRTLGIRRQPPAAGSHTRHFLHDLGYADADIERLGAARVVAASVPANVHA